MPYILVEDFRGGLDSRRTNVTSVPGSLVTLTNAHINRGGEIEKRKAFVKIADLPSNTYGLAAAGGQIYTFGSDAASSVTFASGTPSNVKYVQIDHPTTGNITEVLGVDFFNGYPYISAQYDDGIIYHYWEGQTGSSGTPANRILDWFDGRARSSVTITGGNATSSTGTAATGSFQVTGGTANTADKFRVITINNVRVWSDTTEVQHNGDNAQTATNLAAAINAFTSSPNYTAAASSNTVTITAADKGSTPNGYQLVVTSEGDATTGSINHMSGGEDNAITGLTVDGKAIIGSPVTWETSHSYTAEKLAAEINSHDSAPDYEATAVGAKVNIISEASGTAYNEKTVAMTKTGDVTFTGAADTGGGQDAASIGGYTPGAFVASVKSQMHSLSDSLWHISDIDDPTEWNQSDVGSGSGVFDLSNQTTGAEELMALSSYMGNLAIFAKQAIQIWLVDPDPDKNSIQQVLNNTGTIARKSVVAFGDSDVFYLSESGIRSLKARDSSNSAYVGDIGNPIDDLIVSEIQSSRSNAEKAVAILDPRDGRYMIAIGSKIYVFSFFPASKVSAWSIYEPGFASNITDWAYDGKQVLCRAGNELYSLGGEDNNTYDSTTVTIQLPFLDGKTPATEKDWVGLDSVCENDWKIYMSTDPADISVNEQIGTLNRTTYGLGRIPITGYSSHIAMKLTCTKAGSAKLGNLAIHYNTADAG